MENRGYTCLIRRLLDRFAERQYNIPMNGEKNMVTEKWVAYSWEPTKLVPGGRKRRMAITVEATNRIEAKAAFLQQFPNEMPFSIAASRLLKPSKSKETTVVAETVSSDSSSEAAAPPATKVSRKVSGGKLSKHVLWPQVEKMISVAENTEENLPNRNNAISWLSGVARIEPSSKMSKFCAEKVASLRAAIATEVPSQSQSENDEPDF